MLRRGMVFLCGWLMALAGSAEQTVTIKGSNTFSEELGPRLVDDFQHATPAVTVKLEAQETTTGFAALLDGACDITAASRLINEDELRRARSRGLRLTAYLVGYYGVAVVVNVRNPVNQLTDAQVRDIFTGAVENWQAVGGPDVPIQTYIRDAASGTRLGFQELAMDRRPYAANAKALLSYAAIAQAVQHDPHGIGYVGMQWSEAKEVRALSVNGIRPTVAAVNEGFYPYARQLWLYTNADKESAAARRFIEFCRGPAGQRILSDLGFVRRFERQGWFPTGPSF